MNSSVTTDIVTLYTHGGIPAHIFLFADSMCSHGLPSVPMPVPNLLNRGSSESASTTLRNNRVWVRQTHLAD